MQGKLHEEQSEDLFRMRLSHMINEQNRLVVLRDRLDWAWIEQELSGYYAEKGRPSVPVRVMVSLLLLKQLENLSDERLMEVWVENLYYQCFSGYEYFQKKAPCDASDLVYFRRRIGEEGAKKIFEMSVRLHPKKAIEETEVLMDTTVQEKNITFPTDTKLQLKIIDKCNKIAKEAGVKLKRSFKFVKKKALTQIRMNRAAKTAAQKKLSAQGRRKIKTFAGRIVRDLKLKLENVNKAGEYADKLALYEAVLAQTRNSKNKRYSLHESDVYCISKGKEHKKYEFGNKVGIAVTRKSGIIVGVVSGKNEYDGNFVEPILKSIKETVGEQVKVMIADRGCRTRQYVGDTRILTPNEKTKRIKSKKEIAYLRKSFRSRAGIEPRIGHLKSDHRMNRNFLKGAQGNAINCILACAAFNLKKFINVLFCLFLGWHFYAISRLGRAKMAICA